MKHRVQFVVSNSSGRGDGTEACLASSRERTSRNPLPSPLNFSHTRALRNRHQPHPPRNQILPERNRDRLSSLRSQSRRSTDLLNRAPIGFWCWFAHLTAQSAFSLRLRYVISSPRIAPWSLLLNSIPSIPNSSRSLCPRFRRVWAMRPSRHVHRSASHMTTLAARSRHHRVPTVE